MSPSEVSRLRDCDRAKEVGFKTWFPSPPTGAEPCSLTSPPRPSVLQPRAADPRESPLLGPPNAPSQGPAPALPGRWAGAGRRRPPGALFPGTAASRSSARASRPSSGAAQTKPNKARNAARPPRPRGAAPGQRCWEGRLGAEHPHLESASG